MLVEWQRQGAGGSLHGEPTLNQCLLSIYQPDGDGPPPPSVNLQEIMSAVNALNQGMRATGA